MKKTLVWTMLAAGVVFASTQAKAHDPVAGAIVGGAIGAAAGGPVGAAIGAVLGTAIASDHHDYPHPRHREYAYRHYDYRDPGYHERHRYERHRYEREPVHREYREYREPARHYDRGGAGARYYEARSYREPPIYYREYRDEPRYSYREAPRYYDPAPRYRYY